MSARSFPRIRFRHPPTTSKEFVQASSAGSGERAQQASQLSGGQQAQVALTLALAKRPQLLLLDEPVASLDPLARREFLNAVMEVVVDEGITVVLSSHIVAELERVCDHLRETVERHAYTSFGDRSAIRFSPSVHVASPSSQRSFAIVTNWIGESDGVDPLSHTEGVTGRAFFDRGSRSNQ